MQGRVPQAGGGGHASKKGNGGRAHSERRRTASALPTGLAIGEKGPSRRDAPQNFVHQNLEIEMSSR